MDLRDSDPKIETEVRRDHAVIKVDVKCAVLAAIVNDIYPVAAVDIVGQRIGEEMKYIVLRSANETVLSDSEVVERVGFVRTPQVVIAAGARLNPKIRDNGECWGVSGLFVGDFSTEALTLGNHCGHPAIADLAYSDPVNLMIWPLFCAEGSDA